jgi:hypothetical protein
LAGHDQSWPEVAAADSPDLTAEQVKILAHRGRRPACHSDTVTDAKKAKGDGAPGLGITSFAG